MDWKAEIDAAAGRVQGHIFRTPVASMRGFGLGYDVEVKFEQMQHTGSFKVRGAFNSMLAGEAPAAGYVAASGGNHGAAVAFAKENFARDGGFDPSLEPYGDTIGPTKPPSGMNGLVLRHGYIVAEWGDTSAVDMTFSVTKTYLSTMAGLAVDAGLIADVDDPVRVGERATYVIRIKNQGSAAATNIRIACILEDYVRYVSSAGATSGAVEGQRVRFLPLGTLAPQAEVAWRVVVEAVRPGDMRFKVILNMDELSRPVEETESTHLYD